MGRPLTMEWVSIALRFVHVGAMTFWFGSAIFSIVMGGQPAVQAALEGDVRTKRLVPRLFVAFPVAIFIGIVAGLLLGTVLGPIKSVGVLFGTAYGLTFLAAMLFALVALLSGPGGPPMEWKKQLLKLHVGELALVGAFTCMVLMHYGK
jgi:putative copper export protein